MIVDRERFERSASDEELQPKGSASVLLQQGSLNMLWIFSKVERDRMIMVNGLICIRREDCRWLPADVACESSTFASLEYHGSEFLYAREQPKALSRPTTALWAAKGGLRRKAELE
jgi:hypothetical protein